MRRVKLGIIGTGDVLVKYYLPTLRVDGDAIEFTAVCSADPARAAIAAAALGAPESYGDYREMLRQTSAELILNLTPAQLHYESNLAILQAGKHLYSEKPLARTAAEVGDLIAAAATSGVYLRTAPSVVLDPIFQTLRDALNPAEVGAVAFAHANAFQGGPVTSVYDARRNRLIAEAGIDVLAGLEDKPDQAWFYQKGGGPLYDYGIYQVTLLTALLGPVQRVTALSGVRTPTREIRVGRAAGRSFTTDEDDNSVVLLDFGNATFASLSASWHGAASDAPQVEFICQRGTVSLPMGTPGDRRTVRVHHGDGWEDRPVPGPSWSVASGLPDFARELLAGPGPDTSIAHARHVIDVLDRALAAARTGETQAVETGWEIGDRSQELEDGRRA